MSWLLQSLTRAFAIVLVTGCSIAFAQYPQQDLDEPALRESPAVPDSASPKDTSKKAEQKWDISAKHGPSTDVEFDTDEGTWMACDVSPDGKKIVFDLLGDIYIMPYTGGAATLLSGGPSYEVQPRFSPDGTKISFTSDRDGTDNIWIMDVSGKNPKQIGRASCRERV